VSDKTIWLVQLTSPPDDIKQLELGLDCILACGAFGQSVTVVLCDGAVSLLESDRESSAHERDIARELQTLPLYDINHLYILDAQPNASTHNIPVDLRVEYIDHGQFHALLTHAKHVLTF
jgi:sulfur relay (sulfurtransferase) DsrF/TusC family protein